VRTTVLMGFRRGNSSPPPLENREGSLSRVKIARALPLQAPSNGVPNFGGVLLTVEEMFRVRVGWEVSFRPFCVAVLDVAAAPVEGGGPAPCGRRASVPTPALKHPYCTHSRQYMSETGGRVGLGQQSRLGVRPRTQINLGKYAPQLVRHLTHSTSKNNDGIRK